MNEMSEKIKLFFSRYVGFLAVAMICVVYIWCEFLYIGKTGKTVHAILFDGATAFAAGIGIQMALSALGISKGHREKDVIEAERQHEEAVREVVTLNGMDSLNDWCRAENTKNKRFQRTRILADVGLTYDQCFDAEGQCKEHKETIPAVREIRTKGIRQWCIYRRLATARIRAFRQAAFLRLSELSAGELTGEGCRGNDPFYMGRGIGEYQRQTAVHNMTSKVLTSLVFGYYSLDMLTAFSWVVFVGRLAQVLIFLVLGIFSYMGAYTYMTTEFKTRIITKSNHLQTFLHTIRKGEKNNEPEPNDDGISESGT